jgi:putative nucleotidyltransferase with HDIG domain
MRVPTAQHRGHVHGALVGGRRPGSPNFTAYMASSVAWPSQVGEGMALRLAGSPDDVARAYAWLEIARRRPPPKCARGDDEARQRTAQVVLRTLVGAVERGEPAAHGHGERVAKLSRRLALAAGLSPEEAEVVGQAGLLHDIGKLAVASARDGEQPVLQHRHPVIGAQLVAPFEFLTLAAPMIRHHHERLDGSGHPDGLRGLSIPVGARIIAVADEYDRLRAGAGAFGGLTHEAALARLAREAGRTLDRTLVSALIDPSLP